MRHAPLIVLASAAIATGCASTPRPAYQPPPQEDPVASLQVLNATDGRAAVAIYGDATRCTERRYLPDLLVDERATVTIPADQELALTFSYQLPNTAGRTTCEVTASFQPEAGKLYQAVLRPQPPACRLQIAELVAGQPVTLDATRRVAVQDGDEAGGYCLARD